MRLKVRGGFAPGGAVRWGKWLVLVLWVAVAVAVFAPSNKLSGAQTDDEVSYLPQNAESVEALELEKRFPGENLVPAVVVFQKDGGLTEADLAKIRSDREEIASLDLEGVLEPTSLVPSRNGEAALFEVPIESGVAPAVDEMRSRLGEGSGGLDVKVAGPAGFSADSGAAFEAIDLKLLLATAVVVVVLLLLTYRSPLLWLLPIATLVLAVLSARAAAYGLTQAGFTVSTAGGGIQNALVFGVGTDYALLLISRYREELRTNADRHVAMVKALRGATPAILASALTIMIALLCLLATELNSNRGLGLVGAVGVLIALVAALTALPALLLIFGRKVFWPYVPRYGSQDRKESSGIFARLGGLISPRPRRVWMGTTVVLAILSVGLLGTNTYLSSTEGFRIPVDSVEGQEIIANNYPASSSSPTPVIVRSAAEVQRARAVAASSPGVASVGRTQRSGDLARFDVTLSSSPEGKEALDAVSALRERLHDAVGRSALVGGQSAQALDKHRAAGRDTALVVPLVLVTVLAMLGLLLRSVIAPLILVATVVLSFAASLGASVWVFDRVFSFAGIDPSVPLIAFVFLVGLGIDYNIFLMARAREEAAKAGTAKGMLKALAVTGGVITSAGVVLASTFAVLGVLPLVLFTEIGFIVAFGVLLDTVVVRSILVPALVLDLGERVWWPGSPRKSASVGEEDPSGEVPAGNPTEGP